MQQLAIQNGDLALGPAGFAMVTGESKLRQDLSIALREPYGSDRFHPKWGSTLPTFVGLSTQAGTLSIVRSEVFRVVKNYVNSRLSQMQRDAIDGARPRYSTNEVVQTVDDVLVRQDQDRLVVKVSLTTLAAEQVALVTAVEA